MKLMGGIFGFLPIPLLIPSTYLENEFDTNSLFLLKAQYGGKSPVITSSPDVSRTVDAELEINALRSKQKQSKICMTHGEEQLTTASQHWHLWLLKWPHQERTR